LVRTFTVVIFFETQFSCNSDQTVKNHITAIFDKLGVYSRLELALFAVKEADAEANRPRADSVRHRLARLNRKLAQKTDAQLFSS